MAVNYYILDEQGNPTAEPDLDKWGQWYQAADRHIALDFIGKIKVSTVFLGLDHAFGDGPPVLYETMIFGDGKDEYQERYTNRVAALAGHDQAVAFVRDAGKETDD